MFTTKKKKIRRYLESIPDADKTGFDLLLFDYLNGILKSNLEDMGISKTDIYIDWHDHMKCIGVQGRFRKYYMDLHIYLDEFCISFDLDEPDDDTVYSLESKEQIYRVIDNMIKSL